MRSSCLVVDFIGDRSPGTPVTSDPETRAPQRFSNRSLRICNNRVMVNGIREVRIGRLRNAGPPAREEIDRRRLTDFVMVLHIQPSDLNKREDGSADALSSYLRRRGYCHVVRLRRGFSVSRRRSAGSCRPLRPVMPGDWTPSGWN